MMNKQPLKDTIMEVREDFMLSPAGHGEPSFRTAHFLKPIANSIEKQPFKFNIDPPSSSSVFESKEQPLKINFNGWRYPHTKWVRWVDQLKPKYESVWKKAGIFEAIMSTKSRIKKNQNLVCGVVEKWCCETNTFVFPFGEATITLEDVMVLGSYSLFGDPVFTPLEDQEMRDVEKKLITARQERSKNHMSPSTAMWMDLFTDKGSEMEHEAFLATWLSFFVFPDKNYVLRSFLFPVAVRLARGHTIALAPAVLASLYKDLSLFKEKIVGFKKRSVSGDKLPLVLDVNVQSPFYLVQVWVWERFKNLQPRPMFINNGDPLLLKWDQVMPLKIDNVRLALDSAIDDFIWRPYVRYADKCGVFYPNDEILLPLKTDLLDKKMLSFVTCLRVCELVGFESTEQYLPHRVAMQFGMDQDVPGYVSRFNETNVIAWKSYCRPFSDSSLYFPSRFFKADVNTRYAKWWKKLALGPQGFVKNVVPQRISTNSLKSRARAEVPLEFPPKRVGCSTVTFGKSSDDVSKTNKGDNIVDDNVPSDFVPKVSKTMPSKNSVQDGLKTGRKIESDGPSTLPPKNNSLTPLMSAEECNHVLEDVEFEDGNANKEARLSSDRICQSETETESYSYISDVSVADLERRISRLEKFHTELKNARMEGR